MKTFVPLMPIPMLYVTLEDYELKRLEFGEKPAGLVCCHNATVFSVQINNNTVEQMLKQFWVFYHFIYLNQSLVQSLITK